MSGELDKHLKSYDYGTKADDRWVLPSAHEQEVFEKMFDAFYQQNWPLAEEYAQQIDYLVIQFSRYCRQPPRRGDLNLGLICEICGNLCSQ